MESYFYDSIFILDSYCLIFFSYIHTNKILIMRLLAILIISLFVVFSCDKDNDYSSIIGEWLVEDNGEVSSYRRYNVSIQRMPSDSTLYKIINFYRTGNDEELIVEVDGFELLINGQTVNNNFIQGAGTINADYTGISLEFQVSGGSINETVFSEYSRK